MNKKQIVEAAKLLNQSGFSKIAIKTSGIEDEELKTIFMASFESTDPDDEDKMDKKILETYSELKNEYDSLQNNKQTSEPIQEKKIKNKTIKKEKQPKTISRPAFLKNKINEYGAHGPELLEKLLSDSELLEKYANHKSWIKADFKSTIEKLKKS